MDICVFSGNVEQFSVFVCILLFLYKTDLFDKKKHFGVYSV